MYAQVEKPKEDKRRVIVNTVQKKERVDSRNSPIRNIRFASNWNGMQQPYYAAPKSDNSNQKYSSITQGKWFRMSTIFDDEDERIVNEIARPINERNNYIEAFKLLLNDMDGINSNEFISQFQSIYQRFEKFNALNVLNEKLKENYEKPKADVPWEVLEFLEESLEICLKTNSEFDEEYNEFESMTPLEIGALAVKEIEGLTGNEMNTEVMGRNFPYLQEKYGMKYIRYVQRQIGGPLSIIFKINPEFEIKLSGSNILEMRSEGTAAGSVQTRVQWEPQALNLTTSAQGSVGNFNVGGKMRAYPLSQDHATGSNANADSDHDTLMSKLPALGWRTATGSGTGNLYYIKGHLLNDNMGGIANKANLYPITNEANGQHKNNVEQYINNGLAKGYVYRYEIDAKLVSINYDTTAAVGTTIPLDRYTVDSDLHFHFARLDSSYKDIPGTIHTGKIESRYGNKGSSPYANPTTEFALDYNGSFNNPKAVGSEKLDNTKQNGVSNTNSGLTGNVSNFSINAPTGTSVFSSVSSMGINSSANAVGTSDRLSIRRSTKSNVIDHFDDWVSGWPKTSVTSWVNAVRSNSVGRWVGVWNEATTNHGLDTAIPAKLISANALTRVSINGAPLNT